MSEAEAVEKIARVIIAEVAKQVKADIGNTGDDYYSDLALGGLTSDGPIWTLCGPELARAVIASDPVRELIDAASELSACLTIPGDTQMSDLVLRSQSAEMRRRADDLDRYEAAVRRFRAALKAFSEEGGA